MGEIREERLGEIRGEQVWENEESGSGGREGKLWRRSE